MSLPWPRADAGAAAVLSVVLRASLASVLWPCPCAWPGVLVLAGAGIAATGTIWPPGVIICIPEQGRAQQVQVVVVKHSGPSSGGSDGNPM